MFGFRHRHQLLYYSLRHFAVVVVATAAIAIVKTQHFWPKVLFEWELIAWKFHLFQSFQQYSNWSQFCGVSHTQHTHKRTPLLHSLLCSNLFYCTQ